MKRTFIKTTLIAVLCALLLLSACSPGTSKAEPGTGPDETQTASASASSEAPAATDNGIPARNAIRECYIFNDTIRVSWGDKLKPAAGQVSDAAVTVDGQAAEVTEVTVDEWSLVIKIKDPVWHGQHIEVSYAGRLETAEFGDAEALTNREADNKQSPPWFCQVCVGPELSDGSVLKSISGIAFAPDETLYIADAVAGVIIHLDKDGGVLGKWGEIAPDMSDPACFGKDGPAAVAVLSSGDVYVADKGNSRIMLFDKDGHYKWDIGYAAPDGEMPEEFLNSTGFTEGKNMGGLKAPFRLTGAPDGILLGVLDMRGVVQVYGESLEGNDTMPANHGVKQFSELLLAKDALGEPLESASISLGGMEGMWLMNETVPMLMAAVSDLGKITEQTLPLPAELLTGEPIPVTDIARGNQYAGILDAGNHRVIVVDVNMHTLYSIFGNEGPGAEQFMHPAFIRMWGNTAVIVDDELLQIRLYRMDAPHIAITATAPYKVTSTSADPRVSFNSENIAVMTEKGYVWADHEYPTLFDQSAKLDNSFSDDRVTLENLKPGTRYWVRAYAIVDGIVTYSYEAGFTTKG
jgi:hypothetical protein